MTTGAPRRFCNIELPSTFTSMPRPGTWVGLYRPLGLRTVSKSIGQPGEFAGSWRRLSRHYLDLEEAARAICQRAYTAPASPL